MQFAGWWGCPAVLHTDSVYLLALPLKFFREQITFVLKKKDGGGGQANSVNKRKGRSHKYFQDYKSNSDTECVEQGLKFGEVKARWSH